jgi:hypothetical protein
MVGSVSLELTRDEFTIVQLAVAIGINHFSKHYEKSLNSLVDKFNKNLDEQKSDLDHLTNDEFILIRLAVAMNLTELSEIDKMTLTSLIQKFVQKLKTIH